MFYNWEIVELEEEQQMAKVESEVGKFDNIRTFEYGYFINTYMKLKNSPKQYSLDGFNRNVPEKGEYWKLAVYKPEGERLERKEFDIFKMVRSFDDNLVPSEIESTGIWIDISHQKKYVRVLLHPKHAEKDEDYKVYFIDLDEGKILTPNEVKLDKSYLQSNFVSDTSFHDNLEKQDVGVSMTGVDLYDTYPRKNLKKAVLAQDYPELYKIMQKSDSHVAFLKEDVDIELVQKLAELFFPPGTNVFENVTIPAKYSVDGQEHVVNSAEELQRYYRERES
ncbi:hypothetical protein STRDD11_01175 [Streptococcus sp. DD11]|uniref:hypothetical protein n=1 Tax=Streptococcus sp. DD11 TaxID=1777879 RepID=UPI0007991931|nr:hypothetical protein [Streptococcus sp. DD11]KXT84005.1 hypothetical protein STRDD11_01175 [Streptococcus sp. DD11]